MYPIFRKQLSLKDFELLEAKRSLCDSLVNLLSSSEEYLIANGIKIQPLFNFYDKFNTSESRELFRNKIIDNFNSFHDKKKNFIEQFNSYDFYPPNLPKHEIIKIINNWIQHVKQIGEVELYMHIFSLIQNDENKNGHLHYKENKHYKQDQLLNNIIAKKDNWWLKISCPVCPIDKRGPPKYWPHSGCNKNYNEDSDIKIDINGYIFCNGCHLKIPIKDWKFECQNHGLEKPKNLKNVLEVMKDMIKINKDSLEDEKYALIISNISKMFSEKNEEDNDIFL